MRTVVFVIAVSVLSVAAAGLHVGFFHSAVAGRNWSDDEKRLIASISLDALSPLPPDPSNSVADHKRAAEWGEVLFNDTRLSANGKVACATCHLSNLHFQDGTPLGHGIGTTARRTMPIAGTAHAPFLFWDGRKDSQWAQALGPLESAVEHGTDRLAVAKLVARHHAARYESIFGPLPDLAGLPDHAMPGANNEAGRAWDNLPPGKRDEVNRVFANVGKAIAAFERKIMPGESRFDRYARSLASHSSQSAEYAPDEVAGLALFIGKGNCINCHNGPLLTDNHFHNTGVAPAKGLPADQGRVLGAAQVRADPFNCLGRYSDAGPGDCPELTFMNEPGDDMKGAFKPPSLRNVSLRPPYMHAGQMADLDTVLDHYNRAPHGPVGHSELEPLELSRLELQALRAFLESLDEIGPDTAKNRQEPVE